MTKILDLLHAKLLLFPKTDKAIVSGSIYKEEKLQIPVMGGLV